MSSSLSDQTTVPIIGELSLVDGPIPADITDPPRKAPAAAVAARLTEELADHPGDLVFLATNERRADEIASALGALGSATAADILVLPPWDCLPYDRAAPSRESMGRRMAVLAALKAPEADLKRWVVTSPEAAMQRTPPHDVVGHAFRVHVGDTLDRAALTVFARNWGYVTDDRIDEPGEIALMGEVVDVYPPAAAGPFRISLSEDDVIQSIKAFDAVSQRSGEEVSSLRLDPANERRLGENEDEDFDTTGLEHRLSERYDGLSSMFEFLPSATIRHEAGVDTRIARIDSQIAEAFEARRAFGDTDGLRPLPPTSLYLTTEEMMADLSRSEVLSVKGVTPAPKFAREKASGPALRAFIKEQREADRRVVLVGLPHELRVVSRLLKRSGVEAPQSIASWDEARKASPGALTALTADLDQGFVDDRQALVVITPSDVTGGRIARATAATTNPFGETELRAGDVVIHEDHGLGVLQALEMIEADGVERDVLRLEYHGGATVLAPIEAFSRIWRYGSEAGAVTLDRLNTQGWIKRRAEVSARIDETAAVMVEQARARAALSTPAIAPPRAAYEKFAAGFPFPESADQMAAIEAVVGDLASGKPMNRLVCGDVGFGKTEVALRAAAVVALSGRQVMIVAPTTVLARQHYSLFKRRFEEAGIAVGQLSRMTDSAEARKVKAGLADGSLRVVVGTQALASESLSFADLGLVVIDEEHRFGAKMKAELSARAPHVLGLTATPIPRTLQGAMVGIQDVSVIASPPARRRPIRTFLTDFDAGSVRIALMREAARGGQSFVVAPRIEDLGALQQQLSKLVPELKVVVAHGELSPDDMDAVMTGFAAGDGDVLLATNIIENGLDVPRANTILVWRPDRFGLAQLHQLRGRVGRGRRQGYAYLLSDPQAPLSENTLSRLQTLEALDRLGSGFAISARDLDLRGGGDLVGDEQAGHIRLIGASLYQRVLGRALKIARGEPALDLAPPKLNLTSAGYLPVDYVPDPTTRINLYARLARLTAVEDIDAFHEEIEDRFGPLPEGASLLLSAARLTALALAAGVTDITSGPKATAFTVSPIVAKSLADTLALTPQRRWSKDRLIVDADGATPHDPAFVETVLTELASA
ncbi:helicase-related protein [Brevundimonas goettingensis]|uniref:Transcription-repair-coupling factor n=1 Tax=Brevundimonas goettingensis TaxID=2774190 RepID=A0A975C6I0_9CAUL|nr:helicase-related protein [Brevundimonas goettingensis]QTC92880.1 DEAD/DEAH box helicase [Brevundimonas goettingensis]